MEPAFLMSQRFLTISIVVQRTEPVRHAFCISKQRWLGWTTWVLPLITIVPLLNMYFRGNHDNTPTTPLPSKKVKIKHVWSVGRISPFLSYQVCDCAIISAIDCSQSPIFSCLTVTGILIFKCTEGEGVGDYSSGGGGGARKIFLASSQTAPVP